MPGQSGMRSFKTGESFDGYTVVTKLGEGGFGAVYCVRDSAGGPMYAAKLEAITIRTPVLSMEETVLKALNKTSARHFCKLIVKRKQPTFKYIIMSLVWKSLQELRKSRQVEHFSLSTALRVGTQCLEGLEELHVNSFLHRDVKPGNYAMGRAEDGTSRIVYIIDFGLSRRYKDGNVFREPRKRAAFRGTLRYAPIACHRQVEFSPKDDVESWVYMIIEMTKGVLPWKTLNEKVAVGQCKEDVRGTRNTAQRAALFAGVPVEYEQAFALVEPLTYFEMPDYAAIYRLMKAAEEKAGVTESDPLDWDTSNQAPEASAPPAPPAPPARPTKSQPSMRKKAAAALPTTTATSAEDLAKTTVPSTKPSDKAQSSAVPTTSVMGKPPSQNKTHETRM